jgi:hypothetical protein
MELSKLRQRVTNFIENDPRSLRQKLDIVDEKLTKRLQNRAKGIVPEQDSNPNKDAPSFKTEAADVAKNRVRVQSPQADLAPAPATDVVEAEPVKISGRGARLNLKA